LDPLATLGALQAINRAEELEVLHHGEVAIERESLRDVADVRAHLLAVALDVEAVDGGVAAGRDEETAEDADERRLAGAVRAEETEDLAARDLQRDAVERADGAEVLADVLDVDADVAVGRRGVPRGARNDSGAHSGVPFTPRSTSAAMPGLSFGFGSTITFTANTSSTRCARVCTLRGV